MNNKDMYNRCIIPEMVRSERGWVMNDNCAVQENRKVHTGLINDQKKITREKQIICK